MFNFRRSRYMRGLRPREHRDHDFESHSAHLYLPSVLRWVNLQSAKSHWLSDYQKTKFRSISRRKVSQNRTYEVIIPILVSQNRTYEVIMSILASQNRTYEVVIPILASQNRTYEVMILILVSQNRTYEVIMSILLTSY